MYSLKVEDLAGSEGSKIKSAQKIIDGIEESKNIPFENSLYALGIRFVGKVVAKTIARHFKNIEALLDAHLEDFLCVDGVGEVIANSIISYFHEEKNLNLINRLRQAGVCFEIKDNAGPVSDKLKGKVIVISGVFEKHSREEYKTMIENYGGKNASAISSKTSFILAGSNMGPSKLEKAQQLGVSIISEDDFLMMIK